MRRSSIKHADCVVDQYAKYMMVDDIHINSKLTEGEDIADLGGTVLAYIAWKDADKSMQLAESRRVHSRSALLRRLRAVGLRERSPRRSAGTRDHRSAFAAKYRINGVVVNMPEFGAAFSCKAGSPMVKPADKVCKVW